MRGERAKGDLGFVEPAERKLVDDARSGDPAAFRALVEHYQRRVYAVALGVLHDPDEARDVSQEAFIRVYRNLDSFQGDAQFFTWLYRIVMNLAIDHLRKRRGDRIEFDDTLAPSEAADPGGIVPRRLGFDPGRALLDKELRAQLLEALKKLSAPHRAVLIMREVEGLSYQEMADDLKCSIGTVMSRLFHARKKMQSLLHEARNIDTAA